MANYREWLNRDGSVYDYEDLATPEEAEREWVHTVCSEENCHCRGGGWVLSDRDVWYECPLHYNGQAHPEYDYDYET